MAFKIFTSYSVFFISVHVSDSLKVSNNIEGRKRTTIPGQDLRHQLHTIHICLQEPQHLNLDLKTQFDLFRKNNMINQLQLLKSKSAKPA